MWRPRALAALVGLALLAGVVQGQSTWQCRMAPGSAHTGCGLPYQLSNFQGCARGRLRGDVDRGSAC